MQLVARIQSVKRFFQEASWLHIVCFVVTVVLGTLYIWQVNMAATRGFTMLDLEQAINELELENVRLDLAVSRLQSIDSVSTRVQMLGLTEVQRIEYVVPGESVVAVNR